MDPSELKQEGNEHFRGQRWEQALAAYRTALGRLPKRRKLPEPKPVPPDDDEDIQESNQEEEEPQELTPEELEHAKTRAVLNANIGACYVKLEDHKLAVEACTEALLDDPNYAKALQRRAASNEKLGTWSSLTAAQEDYNTLLKLGDPSVERSLAALKPRLEAAQKRETDEMLGKLKGIGNSILGNFGLSTDNFQFVPNGEGGYSMNFTR
ncbi:TPR-REGION domain-containing protein [Mycena indigotica]|uniref:TPR-REGION domain-containing protein n=1 Tax=Mycena indigotica TaxID=2126181 RepID=A0A8H6SZB9_9AGAR|nr:TPR-REGION domain-containing protein [Mycena indigotica]KAF7306655.1 TPR-REGION domain-containing protein [Mycena indigotica]